MATPFSIIIPAHNEEATIGRCLQNLLAGKRELDAEIIVVCNGCTDKTAEIVNRWGDRVRCIETPNASKSGALNIADDLANHTPRVYLDADVILSQKDILSLVSGFSNQPSVSLLLPKMIVDTKHSSILVRLYYAVWCDLPYVRNGMASGGVYALSARGRARFLQFPPIIADDRFVRALFHPTEKAMLNSSTTVVTAPKSLEGLIKIKTRSRIGGIEFQNLYPELLANEEKRYGLAAAEALRNPRRWPGLLVYLGINLYCKIRASAVIKQGFPSTWERDNSSRLIDSNLENNRD